MFYMPNVEALIQAGVISPDTPQDEAYRNWMDTMRRYAEATHSSGSPSSKFWLVFRVKKTNFSERVDMHETIPMLVPKDGQWELVGIARNKEDLDELVTPSEEPSDPRRNYIFITYKVKIQGESAYKTLLEFLGTHDMLEQDL